MTSCWSAWRETKESRNKGERRLHTPKAQPPQSPDDDIDPSKIVISDREFRPILFTEDLHEEKRPAVLHENWSTPLKRFAQSLIFVLTLSFVSSAQDAPAHPRWP